MARAILYPLLLCIAWGAAAGPASARAASAPVSSQGFCDRNSAISATDQDRQLRFAALIKQLLQRAEHGVALIARAGTDLSRFGIRYSHAGIALKSNPAGPWAVRQLYYACDESRPRLFDQGMAGFLSGTDDPKTGYVSLVLLPAEPSNLLETATLDRRRALGLLATDYSANAYIFGTRYQNCNQWVMEMIASAWGGDGADTDTRSGTQQWLVGRGYAPEPIDVGSHALMFAAHFVPLIHVGDHPLDDLYALKFRVSMPATIEAFVRREVPQARRIELCYNAEHIVVRQGWEALGPGCQPQPNDEVIPFEGHGAAVQP